MNITATKSLSVLNFEENDKFLVQERRRAVSEAKKKLRAEITASVNLLSEELAALEKKEYICDLKEQMIFIPKQKYIIPHPKTFSFYKVSHYSYTKSQRVDKQYLDFCGIKGRIMNSREAEAIFSKNHRKDGETICSNLGTLLRENKITMIACSTENYYIPEPEIKTGSKAAAKPAPSLSQYVVYPRSKSMVLNLSDAITDYSFFPAGLSKESAAMLTEMLQIHDSQTKTLKDLAVKYVEESFKSNAPTGSEPFVFSTSRIVEKYLNSDYQRADLEPYDEKLLTDINRGHWELWGAESRKGVSVKLEKPLIARDPHADIRSNGIIAIDFGTKSTIVVCKDGNKKPYPMRVGIGKLRKSVAPKHYENPTVIEFIDLCSFLRDFSAEDGRPHTKWENLTISHTAQSQMINGSSNDYSSFFSELKQWCADTEHSFKIKDKKGHEYQIDSYISDNNPFDPIEIYSYYLGLYINNMYNGIYLEYMLSFPVTFDKALKSRLKASFEKGIKRSFPKEILDDEETMNRFNVSMDISEPAAYAVCALQQYGFDPDEGEKFYFGVFDFGGGTTDFDFGIWSGADSSDLRYDYVIEHFGAGGDRYLGGENLLIEMAYSVLRDNLELCVEKSFHFRRPPECDRFTGDEIIVNSSQEAAMNLRQTAEALRPIWERSDGEEEIRKNQTISVDLFSEDGSRIPSVTLKADTDKLDKYLKSRIKQGVDNFFESLKLAFRLQQMQTADKINILLAGNSCLSPLVKETFEEVIENQKKGASDKWFGLFPPLGSEEAHAKQRELGIEASDDIAAPTGKTGVAFGLADCRKGGTIKVVSHNEDESGETRFRYFIGRIRKNTLRTIISSGAEYNAWVKYLPADEETFCINYTTLPEASTQKLAADKTEVLRLHLTQTYPEAFIYICAASPDQIKYAVGIEEENDIDFLTEPVTVKLK